MGSATYKTRLINVVIHRILTWRCWFLD